METVVYDLDASYVPDGPFANDVVGAGLRRYPGSRRLSTHITRQDWYALEPDGVGPAVLLQAARGGDLVSGWLRIELLYSNPDPAASTIQVRLYDGTSRVWWNGAAWAVTIGDDWNTPADLALHFPTLDAGDYPRIGLEWEVSIISDDGYAEDRPVVYGALIAAELGFGATFDGRDGRADSWQDDLVHRVILGLFEDFRPVIVHEVELGAAVTVLDFSQGLASCTDAEPARMDFYQVMGVVGVYDLVDDPGMRSPLSGTWDGGASTWTAAAEIETGTMLHVRVEVMLHVGFMADSDYFTDMLPQLLVEKLDMDTERQAASRVPVKDYVEGDALMVGPPSHLSGTATCRIEAASSMVVMQIHNAVKRAIPRDGIVLLSAGTGIPTSVMGPFESAAERGVGDTPGTQRFDLDVATDAWYGEPTIVPLLQPSSFTAQL
jgi:hypothetical protein